MRTALSALLLTALLGGAGALHAQQRQDGPVIHAAGSVFTVPDPDFATPRDQTFRVLFDVAEGAAAPGEINTGLNTVARFLNMHAQAGVPLERLQVAVVVHGTAGKDLLRDAAYRERHGVDNPNRALLEELSRAGVRIILCGQTAASRNLPRAELLEPVEVALSAMTAHLVLQEQGYRVNPF
jgi:intracellular sulfur oxidation DsrE/DsrF family protein